MILGFGLGCASSMPAMGVTLMAMVVGFALVVQDTDAVIADDLIQQCAMVVMAIMVCLCVVCIAALQTLQIGQRGR